ncbi:hypothetical protein B0A50_05789 [Salinomyces thailandicus]|uniref:Cell cycle control protein n=1 Tax=Salinomyces thailandicus TaxID=706561 RepID=A0A4U0TU12_9PEZI|nr:hypothetical protein B0A50_05789 [Salinomyces thailandica]
MGLEDFEKELVSNKDREESTEKKTHKHRSRHVRDRDPYEDRERRHEHRHHHRSHRHKGEEDEDEDERRQRRRHKRHRDDDEDERKQRRTKRYRSESTRAEPEAAVAEDVKVFDTDGEGEDEWVEKEAETAPPEEQVLDARGEDLEESKVQRDAWMQEPSALDIDYVQSRKPKAVQSQSQFVGARENHEFKVQTAGVNQHLADLKRDFDDDDDPDVGEDAEMMDREEPAQHEVSYSFGDSGSSWRMTKLRNVYRQAEDNGKSVDDVALERYGDLRAFDDAREEEAEVDRRKMYGKDYVGKEKPSGELFQERKMKAGMRRGQDSAEKDSDVLKNLPPQGEKMEQADAPAATAPLDVNALNKLKMQMKKAQMRRDPNAAQLEEEYNRIAAAGLANSAQPDVVVLGTMENRQLVGREGEVNAVTGKRGRERGLVTENEDMSIEDMVKHEKRTRGLQGGEGKAFAERIAKDGKFKDDLDYMDDNATNLSKKVMKSDVNLRNTAIGDFQKMQRILESCPLCYHEDTNQPPSAPVVSLATRTYLTLPTEPEIAKGGAVIIPIQHRLNLLECDDDEWEEIRNFMKSLTRLFHAQDKGVLFYENAAHMTSRKGHAALHAIPLPHHLAETAPAYFKEAILSSDEQWSQHKPIIDTLALTQKPGYGKQAFRKAMVKEMAYFHVFFTLDGGMGHVIEDGRRWPKGDLFAREVVGGMLDRGPETIKRQGRWERQDRRIEGFRKKWEGFDWTKVLVDAQ